MRKIIYICLGLLLLTGCSITPIKELNNDAKRFSDEYSQINEDEKNPIVYKTDKEIIDILKSGTGIIYFGFPECPWCKSAIPVLLDAAKDMDIDQIYYFNPKEIRTNNTDTYKEIVKLLGDNLSVDENGDKRLYVPDVYFVSGGKIVGHHFKTVDSQSDPSNNPLNDEQKAELKSIYKKLISKTYNIECDC
jgi:thiol-disulfide isomerase/thioredoxin